MQDYDVTMKESNLLKFRVTAKSMEEASLTAIERYKAGGSGNPIDPTISILGIVEAA